MITESQLDTFKELKGNDIKVLMAVWILGASSVGNMMIAKAANLNPTTVKTSLERLSEHGMITKTHRTKGWHITAGGLQLVLAPIEVSPKISDSGAIINIDTLLITKGIKDNNNTSPKNCDSEILKALFNMGIYNPTAEDLAILDHMTLEYIASWKLALENEMVPEGRADIPLAIHLMKQGAAAPEPKPSDRDKYVQGPYSDMIES